MQDFYLEDDMGRIAETLCEVLERDSRRYDRTKPFEEDE